MGRREAGKKRKGEFLKGFCFVVVRILYSLKLKLKNEQVNTSEMIFTLQNRGVAWHSPFGAGAQEWNNRCQEDVRAKEKTFPLFPWRQKSEARNER